MFRVMIVDDQEVFRQLCKEMLREAGRFEVVAEANNGLEAVEKIAEAAPDLVLMDIEMPRMNGIEATREILQRYPETQIVLVSMHKESVFMHLGHKAGALAFIAKKALTPETLLDVLQSADRA